MQALTRFCATSCGFRAAWIWIASLSVATGSALLACGPADENRSRDLMEASGPDSNPNVTSDSLAHPADLAARLANRYDAEALRLHAQAIVEHERPSGSEGENAAIDYVVSTLSESGVDVEVHEFRAYISAPVSASIRIIGSAFEPAAITMAYSAPAQGLIAEIVDVGTLADIPALEYGTGEAIDVIGATLPSEVSGLDAIPNVEGKIALVTGQPRGGPTAALEALGAAGVVFVNPEERVNDLIVTSTWGSPSLRNYQRLPKIPVAQVARSAGDQLRQQMASGTTRVQLDVEVNEGWRTLRLAVARIEPESRPDAPYVLFGGHIDAWYHGGTDEGASNAAMVSLAQAFHAERATLRRGLVVAWWPGHSNGRYAGSTWFADSFAAELRDRAVAYVNVDGIGQTGASRFAAATTASLSGLARAAVLDAAGVPIDPFRPGTNSDQSFNGIGLPLLQLYHNRSERDRGTWWWHTPEDTFDKIDLDVLKTDADLYALALAVLTAAPLLPLDLVAQAEAAGEALAARASQADGNFDLSAARSAHAGMARAFAELQVDANGEFAAELPDLDVALIAVLRPLHQVLYVEGSPHHPDAGRSPGQLPGLWAARILGEDPEDSNRFGFAATTLRREENRIVEAFQEATDRARQLSYTLRKLGGDD